MDTPFNGGAPILPVKGTQQEQEAALRYVLTRSHDMNDAAQLAQALGLILYRTEQTEPA